MKSGSIGIAVIALLLLSVLVPAYRTVAQPYQVTVTLSKATVKPGETLTVTVLVTVDGTPKANVTVYIYIVAPGNWTVFEGVGVTDAEGKVVLDLDIGEDWAVGIYIINVTIAGTTIYKEVTFEVYSEKALKIIKAFIKHVESFKERVKKAAMALNETARAGIEEKLKRVEELLANATSLCEEGNCTAAIKAVRKAMSIIRGIYAGVMKGLGKEVKEELEKAYGNYTGLRVALQRLKEHLDRIEAILDKAEELGYDVSEAKERLEKARELWDEAKEKLEAGDVNGTAILLGRIMFEVRGLNRYIALVVAHKVREIRYKRFLEVGLPAIHRIIERLKNKTQLILANVTITNATTVLEAVKELKELRKEIVEAIKAGDIDKAKELIKELSEKLRETVREVAKIEKGARKMRGRFAPSATPPTWARGWMRRHGETTTFPAGGGPTTHGEEGE